MHPRTPRSVGVAVRLRYHRRRPRCNSRADCAAASTAKTPTRPRSFLRKRRRLTGPRRLNPPGRCHVLRDRPRRSRPLLDAERTPRPPRLEATSASPPSYRPIENLIATYAELVDNGGFRGARHPARRRGLHRRRCAGERPPAAAATSEAAGLASSSTSRTVAANTPSGFFHGEGRVGHRVDRQLEEPGHEPPHRVGLFVEIPVLTNQSVLAQHRQHGVGQGTGSQYGSPAGRSVRWTQAAHPIVTTAPPGPRSRLAA
jgi:hypothetical protein